MQNDISQKSTWFRLQVYSVLLWYNMKYKKNSMTVVYFYVKGDSHV